MLRMVIGKEEEEEEEMLGICSSSLCTLEPKFASLGVFETDSGLGKQFKKLLEGAAPPLSNPFHNLNYRRIHQSRGW